MGNYDNRIFDDNLFPDWESFEPVRRILLKIGLTEDQVSQYKKGFEDFRHQGPDSPLRLPENILPSETWFNLLFGEVNVRNTPSRYNQNIIESGGERPGYYGQTNLDNIGRDFLCRVYYHQRNIECLKGGVWNLLCSNLIYVEKRSLEYSSLSNSLILVEAMFDSLVQMGIDLSGTDGEESLILTRLPERHLTAREIPSLAKMMKDSTRFSRFVRSLSVCLQDGGKWENLTGIRFEDFGLSEYIHYFADRRLRYETRRSGIEMAMSREFRLWDSGRGNILPSIRTISESTGIPMVYFLRILNNSGNTLGGLWFINTPMTPRILKIYRMEIESRLGL